MLLFPVCEPIVVWMAVLPACLPFRPPACLPFRLPACLAAHLPAFLSTCLPAFQSACLPFRPPACLPFFQQAFLFACLSKCVVVCLSVQLSACLYIPPQIGKLCTVAAAGLFWLQAGQTNTVAGVNNLRGLLFFELMFMSMRAMLSALFTFPAEFKMMLKVKGPACWLCLLPLPLPLPW